MPSTIAQINDLFAGGAESVTLTRGDWEALQEVTKAYCANGLEVGRAQRETERVKRVSRPVWRACKAVAEQMRHALSASAVSGFVRVQKVQDWEIRLRHSMDVSWQDLPANHPKRMVDWRR
jgi:hypothetical protein